MSAEDTGSSLPISQGVGPDGAGIAGLPLGAPSRPGVLGTLGAYEVLAVVGEGGMGVVLSGRDTRNGARVALKMLKPALAADGRAQAWFLKEAQHQHDLNHPHILPVIECAGLGAGAYLAMPYMARGSLASRLRQQGALDSGEALRIARQLAGALAHAHGRGLIHRDLKPSNVLIDDSGGVRLADFGLACTVWNDDLLDVRHPVVVGTLSYFSPATARGEAEDTRADIYRFGAVLYEMLAGRPAYAGTNRTAVLAAILAGPPPTLRSINPHVSPELAVVAEGAMARELCDRYAHMAYVVDDLDRIAAGKPPLGPRRWRGRRAPLAGLMGRGRIAPVGSRSLRLRWVVLGVAVAAGVTWAIWSAVFPRPRLERIGIIHSEGVKRWNLGRLVRWNDPVKRALVLPMDDKLLAISGHGETGLSWREAGAEMGPVLLAADVAGGAEEEMFVGWRTGTNLALSVKNHAVTQVTLKSYRAVGSWVALGEPTIGDTTFSACGQGLLEAFGGRRVLAAINTGYALRPRGVICYDYESEQEIWRYNTAGGPEDLVLADLDGDGYQEVLVVASAVSNGNWEIDGTDDRDGAIYCIEANGRVRWICLAHGTHPRMRLHVVDVDGNGLPEVVIDVGSSSHLWLQQNGPVTGQLLVLDGAGNDLGRYRLSAWALDSCVADVDGDGRPEVLVFDGHGDLEMLDLRKRRSTRTHAVPNRFDYVYGHIGGVADLDGDGHKEIVLSASLVRRHNRGREGNPTDEPQRKTGHDNGVLVLDDQLRFRARYLVAPQWDFFDVWHVEIGDVLGDSRPEVVVFANDAEILAYGRRQSR